VVETAGYEAALHCHKATPGGGWVVVAFKRGVCRPGWPRFITPGWWRLQAMKPRYTATSRRQDGGGLQAGSLQARVAALRNRRVVETAGYEAALHCH
jgi:hypothetical protein